MIINYDSRYLGPEMMMYASKNKDELSDLISLIAVGNVLGAKSPINRLENHKFCFNFQHTTIPDISLMKPLSFAEASLHTAEDMWRFVGSRELVLYWSGGYDSTAAIISLAQTNENWKQQLKILTTPYATEIEYPWFYHNILKDVEVIVDSPYVIFNNKMFDPNKIYTDGNCGDQLFGNTNLSEISPDNWSDHYSNFYDMDLFNTVIANLNVSINLNKENIIDYIERCIKDFPTPVHTIKDIFWSLAFIHKWDDVKYRLHKKLWKPGNPKLFGLLQQNIKPFFDSNYYQGWSLMNPDDSTSLHDYKKVVKEYIWDYTKDYNYNANKFNDYNFDDGKWKRDNNGYGTLDYITTSIEQQPHQILLITNETVVLRDSTLMQEYTGWKNEINNNEYR